MKLKTFQADLSGKVAVITGGGGVLCSAFGEALAASGAKVALLDISLPAAEAAAGRIRAAGGIAVGVQADCLNKESLAAAAETVRQELGPCDLLINGAGGNNPAATTAQEVFDPASLDNPDEQSFFDIDGDRFGFVFDLNVKAAVLTTQVFAKEMLGRGGSILNVSSMNAFRPLTKIPAYSAAKAAVSNLTQWLAVYFAPAGIRVNAIAPGFFITNQNHDLLLNSDGSLKPRAEKIITHTPQKRFGEPADLVGTLLWLASEEASGFVNGTVIPVDGGFAAYSGV
ncbi:MAG: SDR family oxidoreductase [Candidatus Howiella sp.]|jgi:NAD(P)-dependent dehydrogenase (short-subunit alcohol dehydrogenase family)